MDRKYYILRLSLIECSYRFDAIVFSHLILTIFLSLETNETSWVNFAYVAALGSCCFIIVAAVIVLELGAIFFLLFVLSFKRYQGTLKPLKLCETLRELLHDPKEAVVRDFHHNVTVRLHLLLCKSRLTKHSLVITYSYYVCWEG